MESENVTRAEEKEKEEGLQKMAMEHETIRVENSVLSRHLARLVTWKQSDVHLKLGVLEEDAEVMEDTSDSLRSSSSKNLKLVQGSIDASGRQSLRLRSFSTESQDMPTATKELSKFAAGTMAPPLSLEEKCDIVEDENTVLHEQMERTRSENERVLDDLQAVLDETEQCVAEVRKEKSDLKREVLEDARMNGLTKPCTETVLRFLFFYIREVFLQNFYKQFLCQLQQFHS
ncbi:hypothetical protein O6H91_Y259600 [Diphasiastrum complanatum]|nr:hypothetical protein O6H91_Y259600 [Diphasiastrum complanatum]